MESTVKLYSLTYKESRTYLFALLFIAGNILLPQLCHLLPGGGLTWLPIYFFTLIAAYKYGLRVGLLTAILSPLINSLAFGMPAAAVLPIIMIKSSILAIAAAYAAHNFKQISLLLVIAVVLFYQVIGIMVEWIMVKDIFVALQDFQIGIPGILFQMFGGYLLLKAIAKL